MRLEYRFFQWDSYISRLMELRRTVNGKNQAASGIWQIPNASLDLHTQHTKFKHKRMTPKIFLVLRGTVLSIRIDGCKKGVLIVGRMMSVEKSKVLSI